MKRYFSLAIALVLCLCFLKLEKTDPAVPPPLPPGSPGVPPEPEPEPKKPAPKPRPAPSSSRAESRPQPEPSPAPPEDVTPVEREPLFPLDKESLDETERRIGKFLLNIKWGSLWVGDINSSFDAEFSTVDEIDQALLLECCLWNEYSTEEVKGSRREDVERRARFYFGDDVVVDHSVAEEERIRSWWGYNEESGEYYPQGWDRMVDSEPFVLYYFQDGDRYEVFFTSCVMAISGISPPHKAGQIIFESREEAESWYREHGARAVAVLREQKDGRFIMESLKVLWLCDPWEVPPER